MITRSNVKKETMDIRLIKIWNSKVIQTNLLLRQQWVLVSVKECEAFHVMPRLFLKFKAVSVVIIS